MRVLVVSTSFPRSPDDPSGHFVRAEAERLCALGEEVHVVAPGPRFGEGPDHAAALALHWAGGGRLFDWPGAAARLERAPWLAPDAAAFWRGVRRHRRRLGRFDRVEAHWLVPTAWPVLGRVDGALELYAHGADVRLMARMPALLRVRLVGRWLAGGARLHFASHSLRDALVRTLPSPLGASLERASDVRPPALSLPPLAPLREAGRRSLAALGMRHERPIVATVGRLVGSKRPGLGARAVALLGREVAWLVVGDGPALDALARQCREARLDVELCGRRGRPETLALLSAIDVLLHPSAEEGAPTVVREARALGIPVVACRAGDLPRWAAQDQGITLADAEPAALAAALRRALERRPTAWVSGEEPVDVEMRVPDLPPGALPGHAPRLELDPSRSEA